MAPWLIFGAGGKGVGHQIAQLAIAEKHPVIVVVRNRQSAAALEAVGGKFSSAMLVIARWLKLHAMPQEQMPQLFQPWEVRKII